jgi:hypothetical protein
MAGLDSALLRGLQDVDARDKPGMTTLLQGTPAYEFFSPDISGPNNTQLSSLNRIICNCSSGAKSIGLVLILVPGRSNLEIETGGLFHDILAGEVVLALPQHLLEAFGDAVGKHRRGILLVLLSGSFLEPSD